MTRIREMIDELVGERDRLSAAIAALEQLGPEAAPAKMVACPDCGQRMDPRGLGPHRARKHGAARTEKKNKSAP